MLKYQFHMEKQIFKRKKLFKNYPYDYPYN